MEQKNSHLLALWFCLVLTSLLSASSVDAKVPDPVLEQKRSTVTVVLEDGKGNMSNSGSGVVLQQGILATSCYVVGKWLQDIDSSLIAKTDAGEEFSVMEILIHNCRQNIVLARIAPKIPAAKRNAAYKPRLREKIFLVGSPSGARLNVSAASVKSAGGSYLELQTSSPFTVGSAGSAVLNQKGELIGVATFLLRKGQRQAVMIPVNYVDQLLLYYKRYAKKSKEPPTPESAFGRVTSERQARLQRVLEYAKSHTGDFRAYVDLGSAYSDLAMHEHAAEAYREAVRLKPDEGGLYLSLGLSYYRLGRYTEAVEAYAEAVRITPDHVSVYHKLGTAYIILGDYDRAVETFERALQYEPRNAVTRFNLGISHYLKGDPVAAAEEYAELKTLDRERAAILHDLLY